MSKLTNNIFKVALSLVLGGAILYWMYRDFDFEQVRQVVLHEMNWTWMLLSFPFGIMAQAFRGLRWRQTLSPIGEHARRDVAVNAVFLSYAASLIIPRIGEFARCGVLRRWEGTSFPKALGTVVTERAIDSVLVLVVTALTFIFQFRFFDIFFQKTGTRLDTIFSAFSLTGWLVTGVCGVAVLILLVWLFRRMSVYNKMRDTFRGLWEGVLSVKNVANVPLFLFYTLAIWVCYFLHYYLTFFCFASTSHLGIGCALVTFVVGSIAVIVPTPNGAGPWHFAVKTMLMLFGVAQQDALYFVLIVHFVQTLLVAVLGIYAWLRLSFTRKSV
ncbi:MAG: lysylphosphatidylglycerol synthase transmembrane domain-containing protein [Prevotella sp.]|jgi:uncharacterized protein (TIRG00374 family)